MGNNQGGLELLDSVPLETPTRIWLSRDTLHQDVDMWVETYTFGLTRCELKFTTTKDGKEMTISIHDGAFGYGYEKECVDFRVDMRLFEGLLADDESNNFDTAMYNLHEAPMCKTRIAQGGVLKSSSFLYGGIKDTDPKGLIVIIRAKNNDDDKELPYMITVHHYSVSPRHCSRGVHSVATIRSDIIINGGLSFQLEKPVGLPKNDLISMFEDVKVKGWRPIPNDSDYQNKGKVIGSGGKNNNHDENYVDPFSNYGLSNRGHQNSLFPVSSQKGALFHFWGNNNPAIKFNAHSVSSITSRQNSSSLVSIQKDKLVSSGSNNNSAINAHPVSCITGRQNISSLVSTTGNTNGDYNGSMIYRECNVYNNYHYHYHHI